ncbi:copper chaperone PCu(A)C [Modestobacter marinus]|uniref:copper chaperone PCu(A)C n=1 Tax=Modestobacter marinus TaxID=477641 RepID=UPI001C953819|nr:copper chaperone PCu(A)C [Modestobacter marinus]
MSGRLARGAPVRLRPAAPSWSLRTTGLVMAAVVVVLLGTACSRERATPSASTSTTFSRNLDSVDGQAGTIRLLHVYLASPGERGTTHIAGAGAELFLTLANTGDAPDTLIGASSEVAGQVLVRDGDAEPTPQLRVEVPPGGVAPLRLDTGPHLELVDVAEPLRSGTRVSITFEFQSSGSVTLPVPVAVYDGRPPTLPSDPAHPT